MSIGMQALDCFRAELLLGDDVPAEDVLTRAAAECGLARSETLFLR